jgi:hypothetical protein
MDSTTAIAEYHPIETALAHLEEQYGATVWVCDTPERLKAAKASHREIRKWRLALEEERKRLKADVLERGRQIDGEAKRIAARIALVEDPCVAAIKAEEDKKRREEEAARRAEQERIDRCRAEIDRIRGIPVSLTAATAAQIDAAVAELHLRRRHAKGHSAGCLCQSRPWGSCRKLRLIAGWKIVESIWKEGAQNGEDKTEEAHEDVGVSRVGKDSP